MENNKDLQTTQEDDIKIEVVPVVDVYDALKNIMKGYGGTNIAYNDVDPSISITSIVVPNPNELKYQIGQVLNASFGIKITPNPGDATKVDIAIDPTATQLGYQIMNPTLIGGSNISLTKDANAGTIRIDALNSQANAPTQAQVYALNKQIIQSGNVKVTPNDANNTVRLDYALDQAFLYQPLKPTLVAGTNVTLTPNEANQTITVASAGGTAFTPTQANIYPTIKPTLIAGTNVTIVPNDTNNTLTITASAGSAGEDDVLRAKAVNASAGQTTLVALTEPLITKTLADSTYAPSSTLGDQIYAGLSNDIRAGSNISITPNPANKTITITGSTPTPFVPTQANIYPTIKPTLIAGTNTTITPNDTNNTITITTNSTVFTPTQANIYPTIKPMITGSGGINVVATDANNSIALDATALSILTNTIGNVKVITNDASNFTLSTLAITESLVTKSFIDSKGIGNWVTQTVTNYEPSLGEGKRTKVVINGNTYYGIISAETFTGFQKIESNLTEKSMKVSKIFIVPNGIDWTSSDVELLFSDATYVDGTASPTYLNTFSNGSTFPVTSLSVWG